MDDIILAVRYLIGDISTNGSDIFTYGSSLIFSLEESNISSVTGVTVNDTSTTNYSYSSTTNKVTLTDSLTAGDTVEISYTYYPNYSDTEITNYIRNALLYLSTRNYFTWVVVEDEIYPEPSDEEDNLIALIASILIDPGNKTIRLPDITISATSSLSLEEKINRSIASFKRNSTGFIGLLGD